MKHYTKRSGGWCHSLFSKFTILLRILLAALPILISVIFSYVAACLGVLALFLMGTKLEENEQLSLPFKGKKNPWL